MSAETREREAWDARYKHAKAASTWRVVARERPDLADECEALATWMYAYAEADAAAEAAFRALAAARKETP